jgi:hemerythrin-like domain-containing protein
MRYNIFYRIHKGLRTMLYETAIELQRTDFNNEEESETILQKITAVVDLFDNHAHTEDTMAFPAVEQYEPSVVDAFEKEHVKDHELSQKLRTLIVIFSSLKTDDEKINLGSAFRKAFVEFLVFNLEHMAKEEDVINNLLWRYYSDEEIQAIEQKIVSSQTPETAAIATKWMFRGLSNHEIVCWLKIVEKNAPEFVFNNLFGTAEKELPGLRFRQVLEGLTEGAMLA